MFNFLQFEANEPKKDEITLIWEICIIYFCLFKIFNRVLVEEPLQEIDVYVINSNLIRKSKDHEK
mgnify:CR=1 FL=1